MDSDVGGGVAAPSPDASMTFDFKKGNAKKELSSFAMCLYQGERIRIVIQ